MKLQLDRPLVFIDLETTGTSITEDRIVEIALIKVSIDNDVMHHNTRVNPTIPIPAQASEIHGIYDSDVASLPTFSDISRKLFHYLQDCDLAGYNSNHFDIPMLVEEFLRAGLYFDLKQKRLIDVQTIFHIKEPRNLAAAYRFYCNKEIENAHSAAADIEATYQVFLSQLQYYKDLPQSSEGLHEFCERQKKLDHIGKIIVDEKGEPVLNFGKYRGELISSIFEKDTSYLKWLIRDSSLPGYSRRVLNQVYAGLLEQKLPFEET